jgi:hypothetical protein
VTTGDTNTAPPFLLCLRPRRGGNGMWNLRYPYWLRVNDPIRCHCGAKRCADAAQPGDHYWLPESSERAVS